jgi:hypothetical protein
MQPERRLTAAAAEIVSRIERRANERVRMENMLTSQGVVGKRKSHVAVTWLQVSREAARSLERRGCGLERRG